MSIWLSFVAAAATGVFAALVTGWIDRKKLREELEFQRRRLEQEIGAQRERLETEFATEESVEAALHHFLESYRLPYRSFPMIRHHIGGFESNELRRLLVRTGAVRFMAADGTELWALREKVADDFRNSRWKHPDAPLNKVSDNELFPAAFNDPSQN